MENKENLSPILHWAGGKRQLLPEIKKRLPEKFNQYYEPCLGGGAVLFDLQPKKASINDINPELFNLYYNIKWHHLFVIAELKKIDKYFNTEDQFLKIRAMDREPGWPSSYPGYERAARTIYINKTCFNGLYRLNKSGQQNTTYGYHDKEPDFQFEMIEKIHYYFKDQDITITNHDFFNAVKDAELGDFVYFDPPYDKVSKTACHTAYTAGGFNRDDQKRLFECVKMLTQKGVYCMISNAATPFIMDLWGNYPRFKVSVVSAKRSINSNANKRQSSPCEVIITNY
jgi:DNA adenine methylase